MSKVVALKDCKVVNLPRLRKPDDEIVKLKLGHKFRGGIIQAIDYDTGKVWVSK